MPIISTKPRRHRKENLNKTEYLGDTKEIASRLVMPKTKKLKFDDIRGQIRQELLSLKI
jgi:hypothetical protein